MNNKPVGIALLGCTGSIGTSTLEVLANLGPAFRVVTLAAGRDGAMLAAIAAGLPEPPAHAGPGRPAGRRLPARWAAGARRGSRRWWSAPPTPTWTWWSWRRAGRPGSPLRWPRWRRGKQVALANKEALVMAGELVTAAAQAAGVRLRPIDSEHSAIWQCLQGETGDDVGTYPEVDRLIITASGGPFRTWDPAAIARGDARAGAQAPELEHGGQDHDGLGHA